jgi:hypothetical protein
MHGQRNIKFCPSYFLLCLADAKKRIENSILYDVVHGFKQGVLYLPNVILFYGTSAKVILFTSIRKVWVFPVRIFTKITNAQHIYYIQFHHNQVMMVEKMDWYSFTNLREVWPSLRDFHETRIHSVKFCLNVLCRIVCPKLLPGDLACWVAFKCVYVSGQNTQNFINALK